MNRDFGALSRAVGGTEDDALAAVNSILSSGREYALDPQNRVFEMTERCIAKRDVSLRDAFGRIRVLGINPAMDDFRTGLFLARHFKKFSGPMTRIAVAQRRRIWYTERVGCPSMRSWRNWQTRWI